MDKKYRGYIADMGRVARAKTGLIGHGFEPHELDDEANVEVMCEDMARGMINAINHAIDRSDDGVAPELIARAMGLACSSVVEIGITANGDKEYVMQARLAVLHMIHRVIEAEIADAGRVELKAADVN